MYTDDRDTLNAARGIFRRAQWGLIGWLFIVGTALLIGYLTRGH